MFLSVSEAVSSGADIFKSLLLYFLMVKRDSAKKTKVLPNKVTATSDSNTLPKPPVAAKKLHAVPSGKKISGTKTAKAAAKDSVSNTKKEKTCWTEDDDAIMLQAFIGEKSAGNQFKSSWKAGVYKCVAEELNTNLAGGGPKDVGSVHNHFLNLFILYLSLVYLPRFLHHKMTYHF